MTRIVCVLIAALLVATSCGRELPKSGKATPLDPVALAKAHVIGFGITNYDLSVGEIVEQDDQAWTVSFTDPRAKASGWTPYTKRIRVDRETGATEFMISY